MAQAITGAEDHLRPHLTAAIERAECIRMIVAFVMESGAKLIAPSLKQAAASGDVQELADILEVVSALGRQVGMPMSKLVEIADDKRRARGGFDRRIVLIRVED